MTGTATVVGASMLAHGLHALMVLLGLWGLAALLLPQALERRSLRHRSTRPTSCVDDHARRVAELRRAVSAGSLPAPGLDLATRGSGAPAVRDIPARRAAVLGLPLALVAGTTAAGIHAAVAPGHVAENPLFGLFFLLAAGTQLTWVALVATRPTRALLAAGIGLHLALVALWLVTRTLGLPLGLLPEPHPVGGWDVACVLWQLTSAAACVQVLRDGVPSRVPGWFDWHPSTRGAVGAAAVGLVLLTVVGAHA